MSGVGAGVGLPGGKHRRAYRGGSARAHEAVYRASDKGRMARKMYYMSNPEARAVRNLRSKIRRHMEGKP